MSHPRNHISITFTKPQGNLAQNRKMESLKMYIFSGVLLLKNKRPSMENKDRKGDTE